LSSNNDFTKTKYGVVWTDNKLIETVLNQAESHVKGKSLGTKIARTIGKMLGGSKIQVQLGFITYEYDFIETDEKRLYFNKEVDLSESMQVTSLEAIQGEIKMMPAFKPFITQIEQNLTLFVDTPLMFRAILKFLKKVPTLPPKSKKEINNYLAMPDPILEEEIEKSQNESENLYGFTLKYANQLSNTYPNILKSFGEIIFKEKPSKMSFLGENMIVYNVVLDHDKLVPFVVAFPEEARSSLSEKNGQFAAKVLGIVSLAPNPIYESCPYFMRAVSLLRPC